MNLNVILILVLWKKYLDPGKHHRVRTDNKDYVLDIILRTYPLFDPRKGVSVVVP